MAPSSPRGLTDGIRWLITFGLAKAIAIVVKYLDVDIKQANPSWILKFKNFYCIGVGGMSPSPPPPSSPLLAKAIIGVLFQNGIPKSTSCSYLNFKLAQDSLMKFVPPVSVAG